MFAACTSAKSSKRIKIVHYVGGGRGIPEIPALERWGVITIKHEWILRKCTIAVVIWWYCLPYCAPLLPQDHDPPVKKKKFSEFLGPTLKDIVISL